MAPLAPALPILATIGKIAAIGGAATSVVGAATGNKTLMRIGGYTGLAGAGLGLGAGLASAASGVTSTASSATASSVANSAANSAANSSLSIMGNTSNALAGSTTSSLLSSGSSFGATSAASAAGSSTAALPSTITAGATGATGSAGSLGLATEGVSNTSGIFGSDPTNLNIPKTESLNTTSKLTTVKDTVKSMATPSNISAGVKVATVGTGVYSSLNTASIQRQQVAAQRNYYNQQVATEKAAKYSAYTTAKENRSKAASYGYNLSNMSTSLNNLYSGPYSTTSGSAGIYTPSAKQYSLLG